MPDPATQSSTQHARWGGLATTLWALLLAFIYIVVQTTIFGIVVYSWYPDASEDQFFQLMMENTDNGRLLALATVGAALVVLPLLLGISKLKRRSVVADYFGIRPVEKRILLKWVLIALALGVVFDVVKWAAGLQLIPEFGINTYQSMGAPWLFLPTIIVLAPLIEEAFFRGFLISGFERTFIGPIGSVLLTAALWAGVHTQYDLYDMTWIFVLGCVLGMSRILTGSIYPALVIHIVMNLLSYAVVGIYVERYST